MAYNSEAAWDAAERDFPDATRDQLVAVVRARAAAYRAEMVAAGLEDSDCDEDVPEDSPTIAHCDDWGTGEGRFHGRI